MKGPKPADQPLQKIPTGGPGAVSPIDSKVIQDEGKTILPHHVKTINERHIKLAQKLRKKSRTQNANADIRRHGSLRGRIEGPMLQRINRKYPLCKGSPGEKGSQGAPGVSYETNGLHWLETLEGAEGRLFPYLTKGHGLLFISQERLVL